MDAARAVVSAGVAVMGHVGLTPQSVSAIGGFRPQAQQAESALQLIRSAQVPALLVAVAGGGNLCLLPPVVFCPLRSSFCVFGSRFVLSLHSRLSLRCSSSTPLRRLPLSLCSAHHSGARPAMRFLRCLSFQLCPALHIPVLLFDPVCVAAFPSSCLLRCAEVLSPL